MNEMPSPTTANNQSRQTLNFQLQKTRIAGQWMVWSTLLLAILWWSGMGAVCLIWLGWSNLSTLPPLVLFGGSVTLFTPGFAFCVIGFMARQTHRSSLANALVLEASSRLLSPAEDIGTQIHALVDYIGKEAEKLEQLVMKAAKRVEDIAAVLDKERSNLSTSVENAQTATQSMINKMSQERESLSRLYEIIKSHSEQLYTESPKQVKAVSQISNDYTEKLNMSERTINTQISALTHAAQTLSDQMTNIEKLAETSAGYTEDIQQAIQSVDQRILASTKVIEASINAGELATHNAKEVAEAVNNSINKALLNAAQITQLVQNHSKQVIDAAGDAMEALRKTAEQAEETTHTSTRAIKAQAEEMTQHIGQINEHMLTSANRATQAAEAKLEQVRTRIEQVAKPQKHTSDNPSYIQDSHAVIDTSLPTPDTPPEMENSNPIAPPTTPPSLLRPPTARTKTDAVEPTLAEPTELPQPNDTAEFHAVLTPANSEDLSDHPDFISHNTPSGPIWRNLLSNIDGASDRDEEVTILMDTIKQIGINLDKSFKSSVLKTIAKQDMKGERHRRRVVRNHAVAHIKHLTRHAGENNTFMTLCQRFLAVEKHAALQALHTSIEKGRHTPNPRLIAFLLIDTALN